MERLRVHEMNVHTRRGSPLLFFLVDALYTKYVVALRYNTGFRVDLNHEKMFIKQG